MTDEKTQSKPEAKKAPVSPNRDVEEKPLSHKPEGKEAEEEKMWKGILAVAIASALWSIALLFRITDQAIYLGLVIITLIHTVTLGVAWELNRRGVKDVQIGLIKTTGLRFVSELGGIYALIELFLVFSPMFNVLPPNIPPFTWGMVFLFYGIEAFVILISLELAAITMLKFKKAIVEVGSSEKKDAEMPKNAESANDD